MEEKKSNSVINKLLDTSQPFPPHYLHIFSDITPADLEAIKEVWPQVAVSRKVNLLQDLETMMEAETLLSCDDFARFALEDEDPNVRSNAISLLWECEDPRLAARFGEILSTDSSELVRTAAAAALGKFTLMGELDEISKEIYEDLIEILHKSYAKEEFDIVRQEILRTLSYNGEKRIQAMIQQAFTSGDKDWMIAALESMGRSADHHWKDHVLEMLRKQ